MDEERDNSRELIQTSIESKRRKISKWSVRAGVDSLFAKTLNKSSLPPKTFIHRDLSTLFLSSFFRPTCTAAPCLIFERGILRFSQPPPCRIRLFQQISLRRHHRNPFLELTFRPQRQLDQDHSRPGHQCQCKPSRRHNLRRPRCRSYPQQQPRPKTRP